MVDVVSKKVFNSSNVEIQLPNYLLYEVTYPEGIPVETNQLLAANSSETIKVRVEYKRDISEDDLLDANTSIKFKLELKYEQSDEATVVPVRIYLYTDFGRTATGDLISAFEHPSYSSLEELFEYPHDFFIRHSIVDNSFYTSELGFSYNNNLYYLPATESEFDLIEKPLYEARKAYLTSVFGSEKCSSVGIGICYNCNIRPNVRVGVCATGYAEANSEEGYMCRVSIENDRTISNCAEFQPT